MAKIGFGPLEPTLRKQLSSAGAKFPAKVVAKWEGHRTAILRLHLNRIITDTEADRAFKRLVRVMESEARRDRNF